MAESRFEPVAFPDLPFAADIRAYCLDLPDAWEDYPWGDIVYKVGTKMFAGVDTEAPLTVTVKATPEDAEELIEYPHISTAPYVGRYGWVSIVVENEAALDQTLALISMSYDLVRRGSRARQRRPDSSRHVRGAPPCAPSRHVRAHRRAPLQHVILRRRRGARSRGFPTSASSAHPRLASLSRYR